CCLLCTGDCECAVCLSSVAFHPSNKPFRKATTETSVIGGIILGKRFRDATRGGKVAVGQGKHKHSTLHPLVFGECRIVPSNLFDCRAKRPGVGARSEYDESATQSRAAIVGMDGKYPNKSVVCLVISAHKPTSGYQGIEQ